MMTKAVVFFAFAYFYTTGAPAQSVPIYQVTVVERTVKAVDYQYRNGPTRIDFRGTVLMPPAKGEATVESKTGRTVVAAKFEHVEPPTRFGAEYLTYVLWAISPQGHAKNLGEVVADGSNRAHLQVTTDLQAFGLIVTAEPYAAVRQPSNVVVLENEIRPDTSGKIEPILAKAELLPRGHYTYTVPVETKPADNSGAVSMSRYESLLEVYEAQNAVQIARAAGADRYAADTLARAEELLRTAQRYNSLGRDRTTVVTEARQAAQTAEDARLIAEQRKHADELAQAQAAVTREQQLRAQAEAEAARARAQASADRMQLERERAQAVTAPPPPTPQPAAQTPQPITTVEEAPAAPSAGLNPTTVRAQLLSELNGAMVARDTPRGLVVTVADSDFRGGALRPEVYSQLSRVASILAVHPGLFAYVEGNSDTARDEREAYDRAMAVHDALVRAGVPAASITARSLGDRRPIVSNASSGGRLQNRRVEITIAGDPIGTRANWDKPYSLVPGH